jgi:ppGpp synthetase/RelA/SpoT-type nucleotidyltranferase
MLSALTAGSLLADIFESLPARRLTVSEINRLGRRLKHGLTVSPEDLELLQVLRAEHFDLLMRTQESLLTGVTRIRPTSRLKTVQTIVEKLKRERTMALSRMRDIAGVRIVDEMDRREQDVLVSEVGDALANLGTVRIIDRRTNPTHGYRAVHVELNSDARYVEIQVRTRRQDQWAQIVERLGDRWGRQIRYGRGPTDPERSAGPFTRASLWEQLVQLAEVIDNYEQAVVDRDEQDEGREVLANVSAAIDLLLDGIQRAAETGRL